MSVVLISMGDASLVAAALDEVAPRCRELDAELVIVHAGEALANSSPLGAFAEAKFIFAPADAPASQLRDLGMREAVGDIVTFRSVTDVLESRRSMAPLREIAPVHRGFPLALGTTDPATTASLGR